MNVLVNAYACSPDMGSEPGMAWNWCVSLARHCKLFIITEGEFRKKIETELDNHPLKSNLQFYYNPVSDKIRKMCWNQGNWMFYNYYKRWQKTTLEIAKKIVKDNRIDVVHQLNMIGFREPGYLWKLKDIPFVWGPVGGIKQFPESFLSDAGLKYRLFYKLKNRLNLFQLKNSKRVDLAFKASKAIISSIPESKESIKKYKHYDSIIIPETGCFIDHNVNKKTYSNGKLSLIWIGKFDFRKRLDIALKTISSLTRKKDVILYVCGSGNENQMTYYKKLSLDLGVGENVVWMGNIPHEQTIGLLKECDALFFTSINDDTSTVVMESISCLVPVICHDAFGFGHVVNSEVGFKIPLINQDSSVRLFAEQLDLLINNRGTLQEKSNNCIHRRQELSWNNKADKVLSIYNEVLGGKDLKTYFFSYGTKT